MPSLTRICVFCGSRNGERPEYVAAARALGVTLARKGIGLVFGGGKIGLMGAIADAVLEAGGSAIGVMPQRLIDREIAHKGVTELHVVNTMHQRKALMEKLSDAFIAIPGGFGSAEWEAIVGYINGGDLGPLLDAAADVQAEALAE